MRRYKETHVFRKFQAQQQRAKLRTPASQDASKQQSPRCKPSMVIGPKRLNLRNKTAYTLHSDPHGIIYVDQFKWKRLMRTDEHHKFSDGTLNDVQTALHDIVAGIRMEYLPMRKWSNLDKKMARVMVQDIDKHLYQRMLMRNVTFHIFMSFPDSIIVIIYF
ncbi:hypothetical protein Tco_0441960 [Tanacetum coccineum]